MKQLSILILFLGFAFTTELAAQDLAGSPFVSSQDHDAIKGKASINWETLKISLSKDFKTQKGRDLQLVLHKSAKPGASLKKGDYKILGDLRHAGAQEFIWGGDGPSLKKYESVVVWCREFNAVYGWASIGKKG